VLGDRCIAHAQEQLFELIGLRISKFDELESIRAGRVLRARLIVAGGALWGNGPIHLPSVVS
jgi:hypothetical protein